MNLKQLVKRGFLLHGWLMIGLVQADPLHEQLSLQGISFQVRSENTGSVNKLRIQAKGLQRDNKPIFQQIDGVVTAAEVADLNADGAPEIYVFVTSAGPSVLGLV